MEYKGNVVGYNPKTKIYQTEYEDGDQEEFYHNEVHYHKEHQLPRDKRWTKIKNKKKKQRKYYINLISKVSPSPIYFEEHVHELSIDDICAIGPLKCNDLDMYEEAIPSYMIQLCINTLNSDKMTKEEKDLGYFTIKKLKRLQNWDQRKSSETLGIL